jgi:hypothetical protein
MPELCFALSPRQDPLFVDIAEALRDELRALGAAAEVVVGELPEPTDGRVYVLPSPLEQVELRDGRVPARVLPRAVFVCAEEPGTRRFDANLRLAGLAGAVMDVSRAGVRELRRVGIRAEHLRLGYTAAWDRCGDGGHRDIDLAFLASPCPSFSDRRDGIVAAWADWLWRHRVELVIPDNLVAKPATAPDLISGDGRRGLFARTKALLNIHPGPEPAFPWWRVLDAIHCGAVVVTEASRDYEPLVPGEHFLSAAPEALPVVAGELLEDPDRRREMAAAAREAIVRERPTRAAAERLAAVAEALAAKPIGRGLRARLALRSGFAHPEPRLDEALDPLRQGVKAPARAFARARKRRSLEAIERERTVSALVAGDGAGGAIEVVLDTRSASAEAAPRVSVIVPVYNEAGRVGGALESVRRSRLRDLELVVVDDGSVDGSLEVVREWMRANISIPGLLLRQAANRGLPASRNAAIEHARGEEVLPLDADNRIYPHCLERLTAALDSDPAAPFAYGILQTFDDAGPRGVIGYFDWAPARLRRWNYIDALALIRKRALLEVGGFATDIRLYGWEDYDLWCAFAARGMRPVHVREIVGRYRRSAESMLSLTNLSQEDARAALAERHPELFSAPPGDGGAR